MERRTITALCFGLVAIVVLGVIVVRLAHLVQGLQTV